MGELVETQAAAAGVTFHRERAGGTISFTSEEGVGTTFTIEFRFLLAPETEKGDNSKDNTMQDFRERSRSVRCIDQMQRRFRS